MDGWIAVNMELHFTAMGCHLPYGITQCIPSTRHKWTHPALTPASHTRLTYPGGMEGWVHLGERYWEGLPARRRSSSNNRAQCRLTTLIEAKSLTTTLRRHPCQISISTLVVFWIH